MYVYLYAIADNIKLFASYCSRWALAFFIIYIILYIAATISKSCDGDNCYSDFFLKTKKSVVIFIGTLTMAIGLFSVSCLMPSTKQFTIIYLIPKIINNEEIKKIPPNIAEFINTYLEEVIRKKTNIKDIKDVMISIQKEQTNKLNSIINSIKNELDK